MLKKTMVSLATASALMIGAGVANAKDVTLRYSNWLPAGFFLWEEVYKPYLEEIEKVTEGRVKVEILPKVVGSVSGQYDVVADGLADMSFMVLGYTPDRFTVTEFAELPLLDGELAKLGPAYERVYRKHIEPLDIFPGVHILSISPLSPLQIETHDVKVSTLADMQGLKFRTSTGTLTKALELMGATPIAKSSAEAYEMLAAGLIDGEVTQPSSVTGFNRTDLHNHLLILNGGISNSVDIIGINKAKWSAISPVDQAAISAISGEALGEKISAVYVKYEAEAVQIMRDAGYEITEASPEVNAEFAKVLAPIEAEWIERATEAGLKNAAEVLQEYRNEISGEATN